MEIFLAFVALCILAIGLSVSLFAREREGLGILVLAGFIIGTFTYCSWAYGDEDKQEATPTTIRQQQDPVLELRCKQAENLQKRHPGITITVCVP